MVMPSMTQPAMQFDLSPSAAHYPLTDGAPLALSYRGGDVARWQQALRQQMRAVLGVDQMPAMDQPIQVRTLWKREHELGTIEKLVFTSEPGVDVPCYLCLPHEPLQPRTTFICLQGHSTGMHRSVGLSRADEQTAIEVDGDRAFALGCMKRGLAALCIEQRSLGERQEQHQQDVSPQACHDAAMHAMMLGRTLVGERVYDVMRAVRMLGQRDEVDAGRIGIMGNSGGGTVTIYAAAIMPEIRWTMPSCSLCSYRASIMRIHHCCCNYLPGILRYAEAGDVLGLIAPRPVVVVTGKDDPIFPLPGVRDAFEQASRIYSAFEAGDQCQLVIGDGEHRFYEQDAWDAMMPILRGTQ